MEDNPSKNRKRYDSEDSKKRLLKAALDIFSKEGFEAATTRAIAKKAGVNDSLIQRYFGGKLGLLLALFQSFKESQFAFPFDLDENASEQDVADQLDTFFRARLDFFRKHKKLIKILVTQSIVNKEFREQTREVYKQGMPKIQLCLEKMQIKGKLAKDLDVAHVSRILGLLPATLGIFSEVMGSLEPEVAEQMIPVATKLFARALKK